MYKIVRKTEAAVREIAKTYKARNYITKDDSLAVSLAFNTGSSHSEIETTNYDRIYYVVSGELSVTIDGVSNSILAGDCLFISKGTTYKFSGTFESVVVNQPSFGA